MNLCDKYKLDKKIEYCKMPIDGVDELVLINFSDIEGVTYSSDDDKDNVITNISLKSDAKGYLVKDGRKNNPYDGSEYAHEDSVYGSLTSKTIQYEVADNGQRGARDVKKLDNKYVAIAKLSNGEFEIIGIEVPLKLTDKTRALVGGDNKGWVVTMNTVEPSPGLFLFDTDEATTLATYESLKG